MTSPFPHSPPARAEAEEFEAQLARLRDESVDPVLQQYWQSGGGGGAAGVGDFDDEFFSGTQDEHDEL
jgi:hypothetical protein